MFKVGNVLYEKEDSARWAVFFKEMGASFYINYKEENGNAYVVYSDKTIRLGCFPDQKTVETDCPSSDFGSDFQANFENGGGDFPYIPCVCPLCGKLGFEFDGRGNRVCGHLSEFGKYGFSSEDEYMSFIRHTGKYMADFDGIRVFEVRHPDLVGWHPDKGYSYDAKEILNAYKTAREAKLEQVKCVKY